MYLGYAFLFHSRGREKSVFYSPQWHFVSMSWPLKVRDFIVTSGNVWPVDGYRRDSAE